MTDNILRAFKYSQKEDEAIVEMLQQRNKIGQVYFEAVQSVDEQKEKLMKGKTEKWDLSSEYIEGQHPSHDELKAHPLALKHLLLPAQRAPLAKLKTLFGYFNQQMINSCDWLGSNRAKRYAESLAMFSAEKKEIANGEIRVFSAMQTDMQGIISEDETKQISDLVNTIDLVV